MGLISLIEKSIAIGTYKRTSVCLSEVRCDQFIISMARVKKVRVNKKGLAAEYASRNY